MTTHRLVIEIRWSRNLALALAIALAIPILAITGLLTALAAHPGAGPASVALSAPTTLAYQGQVQVNRRPFTGAGQFKFAIVDAGGFSVWTNDGTHLGRALQPDSAVSLSVAAGLFNVLLGDTTLPNMTQPITSGVFLAPSRALRVWFNDGLNGFQQLAPDVALAAVPYALNAQTLDGLDSGAFLTQYVADGRYAQLNHTTQQIAMLKWYMFAGGTFPVGTSRGSHPWGIAFDGANMWVVNQTFNNPISVLRASDGFHVMSPTVGSDPWGLAFDGANMWVTNRVDNNVSVVRASDGFHVMTPTVGSNPEGIAFDGANMWVVNNGDNTVSVVRASDGFNVMTAAVGLQPSAIAFDGANMWVTNSGAGTVSVVRASDGFYVRTPTVGFNPHAIAFDGANMWVPNSGDDNVSVLRASDGFHVMTPTVGSFPRGIAFDGANMWVVNSFVLNTVSVLRASDGFHVYTPTVGAGAYGIAFDGAFMWVTNAEAGTVSKL
jgi:hypothetical protein